MPTYSVARESWLVRLVLSVAMMAAAMAVVVAPAPAAAADDGGLASKMLELVNQHRAAAGVPAVQWSPALAAVAGDGRYDGCGFPVPGRAADMGARNYFSHTILGCGTQGVSAMLGAAGIRTSGFAENIAWMNATTDPLVAAQRLTNDLMASPGHRANILNRDFTHLGIGSWRTAPGGTWTGGGAALANVFIGVQVFGRMTSTSTPPPTATAPEPPTAVTATARDGAIDVTWGPAASGPAVDGYGVFAWDAAGYTNRFVTACATCRAATLTGLVNGRQYYVTVYGHNGAGWGEPGLSRWVTVAAVPGAPTLVGVTPANASMTATWRAPTNPGTAIDGYGMFVYDANGYTGLYTWVCAACTTATVTGLTNGRTYYALLYAHNPNGWGTPVVNDWVVAGAPGPPGHVAVTRGDGSVGVSWTPAANSGSAIDLYGMFAFDANGYTGLYATACAACSRGAVTGLTNGRSYTIVVYAHNAHGWGAPVVSGPATPTAA